MVRPLRIEYPGAVYHITCRGIDRREIFNDDRDRERLIELLNEGADFYRVEVFAYCLMSNHFHFLIRTAEANLSRFMQRLNVAYTQSFNRKHKRVGPLMQGRYKAILVESAEYFLALSRYIHLNPVKIKSIKGRSLSEQRTLLKSYKWSSYPAILEPWKRSRYFKCEQVLNSVGGDTVSGRKRYEEYIIEGITAKVANPMDELQGQFLLGSKEFIEQIKRKYINGKDLRPFASEIRDVTKVSTAEIAEKVASDYGINPKEIIEHRSKHKEPRKVLIELSRRLCLENKTLVELGKELGGISGAGIARVHERMQKTILKDKGLRDRIEKLAKRICQ